MGAPTTDLVCSNFKCTPEPRRSTATFQESPEIRKKPASISCLSRHPAWP